METWTMSHGIKLFPTVPNYDFTGSNDGWTAESGASIYAASNSILAQSVLHIVSSGETVGAKSPTITLLGSETPVRAEVLFKTADSSQTFNVSILDQGDSVIASTVFPSSAFSTTYNDFRRGVVDVDAPTGTTGVYCRLCRGNDIAGEITIESVGLHENILLKDPESSQINRSVTVSKSEHVTLSGRRIVDTFHRHYNFSFGWNALEAASYDRIQEFMYRGESLWLDDGDVPANQEVHPTYTKGKIDYTNIRSEYAGGDFWVQTLTDSLLPNDSGFPSSVASWADGEITNLSSSNGASFTTSLNSAYTYALFTLPTVADSIGKFDYSQTLSVDVLTEVKSTAPGPFGFDVWVKDAMQGLWRKTRSVVRTGEVNLVMDMRSTDMLSQFTDSATTAATVQVLFRARSTNRVPGATLTFKNFKYMGNHGFDWGDTNAETMGPYGAHVVELWEKPKSISHVQLDSRQTTDVRAVTSLVEGTDFTQTEKGIALALPSTNANANQYNNASVQVRYVRDFRVVLDALPETFMPGATTSHDRVLSLQAHTVRPSGEEVLNG